MSGRFRFQLLDLVELCNKSCHLVIFTGQTAVSQDLNDLNDLFNVADVFFVVVNGVLHSGDGGEDCLVGRDVICEGD